MDKNKIKRLIFTSSVAVYGFVTEDTGEDGKINPFHEYGDSKYKAEQVSVTIKLILFSSCFISLRNAKNNWVTSSGEAISTW